MSELTHFEQRLSGLIEKLSPASRRQLATKIAKALRASQQQRIKRQQTPEGTAYAARKTQPIRGKKGRVKRAMFIKLRTNRYMKANSSPDEAVVEFAGRVERMARVHHFGLRDRPSVHSKYVQYDERSLLGFDNVTLKEIEITYIKHINI